MKYAWSEGTRLPGDPQEVGKELEHLKERYGGALNAETVVNEAKSKKSPLHRYFEWDDSEAAHQYRLEQARHLMRHIIVISNGDKTPRRAFVQVKLDEERVYMDTVDALSDESLRLQVLARAKQEMDSFVRRYGELEELAAVITAAKKTSKGLNKFLVKAGK